MASAHPYVNYWAVFILSISASFAVSAKAIDELAYSNGWLKLLHYAGNARAWTSTVTSTEFFLSPTGRHNPQAEMRATLAAMRAPITADTNTHALCQFPARRAFLERHLAVKFTALPCPDYQAFSQSDGFSQTTIIFAEGYLDSPGSVFGHLFLRLSRAHNNENLLDPTLNFTADMGGDSVLQQIIHGVVGGYPSQFHYRQFYEMVNDHHRDEHRDFWEYPLNLTPSQLQRLVDHYWEIRAVNFDYYFMSDNCVTQLLALLEAAVPELNILERSGHRIMPFQSLSFLQRNTTLLKKPYVRASLPNRIRHHEQLLPAVLYSVIRQLTNTEEKPDYAPLAAYPVLTQARALDVAIELLDYLHSEHATDKQRYQTRRTELLTTRNALAIASQWPTTPTPKQQPTRAHGASRGTVGVTHQNNDWAIHLGARFIYHDMLDPGGANPWGTAVEMFDLLGRYQHGNWQLERLTLLNLTGLYPRSGVLRPWSFRTKVGFRHDEQHDTTLAYASTGRGVSWGNASYLTYLLGNITVNAGKKLSKGWQLTPSITAGLLLRYNQQWAMNIEVDAGAGILGDTSSTTRWRVQQQWSFNAHLGIRLSVGNSNIGKNSQLNTTLSLHTYW